MPDHRTEFGEVGVDDVLIKKDNKVNELLTERST
jgi:hypothetical protein